MSEPSPPPAPESLPSPPRSIMNRLVASSLHQPLLIFLMTALLLGLGIRSLDRLPVDAYPDLSPPMVELITQWPGHTAEEVERLITVPVERGVNGTPHMTA
ncbi:MAG TPA: efflux RND transporter permease subunit, partial [Rhizomicrobium sp.]|nr:efflux RND transporter permease subunit [Rhizomicrobium sp.]